MLTAAVWIMTAGLVGIVGLGLWYVWRATRLERLRASGRSFGLAEVTLGDGVTRPLAVDAALLLRLDAKIGAGLAEVTGPNPTPRSIALALHGMLALAGVSPTLEGVRRRVRMLDLDAYRQAIARAIDALDAAEKRSRGAA